MAPKLAEEQNRLWPMYGNQDDAKHTVAAAVKKQNGGNNWHAGMAQLPQRTYYSLLSIIWGNAQEGVGSIIEIQG